MAPRQQAWAAVVVAEAAAEQAVSTEEMAATGSTAVAAEERLQP